MDLHTLLSCQRDERKKSDVTQNLELYKNRIHLVISTVTLPRQKRVNIFTMNHLLITIFVWLFNKNTKQYFVFSNSNSSVIVSIYTRWSQTYSIIYHLMPFLERAYKYKHRLFSKWEWGLLTCHWVHSNNKVYMCTTNNIKMTCKIVLPPKTTFSGLHSHINSPTYHLSVVIFTLCPCSQILIAPPSIQPSAIHLQHICKTRKTGYG